MTSESRPFKGIFYTVIGCAGLLYAILNPQYQTGAFNDDAQYLIAAHDLWHLHSAPMQTLIQPSPDFPFPGLPLLLAPLVKMIEPHWTLIEWMSVLTTVLSIYLLGQWLKKWVTPIETLLIVACYAFNPTVARFSGILMPAPYFAAAIFASFLLLNNLLEVPAPMNALRLGLVLAWGSLIRPEGILLLLSIPLALVVKRRWKNVWLIYAAPAVCWILFAMRWLYHPQTLQTEYGSDLGILWRYWPQHALEVFRFSGKLFQVLIVNTLLAIRMGSQAWAFPVIVVMLLFAAALMLQGWVSLWKGKPANRGMLLSIAVFFFLYFAIHVFWHVAIPRYCVILIPYALIFLVRGMKRIRPPGRSIAFGALMTLIVLSYGYRNGYAIHESLWAPDPMKSPPWRSLEWLEGHTELHDQILSTIAPSIVLYANRSAMSQIKTSNSEDFFYFLAKTHLDYIVDRRVRALSSTLSQEDDPNEQWKQIRLWIRQSPQHYAVVFEDPLEKVTIYHVMPEPGFRSAYELYIEAVKALQSGRVEEAVRMLHQALATYPQLGSAANALGVIDYLSRRDLKEAEAAFIKTIDIQPDSAIALLNLAALYHLEGKSEASLNCLRRGVDVSRANGEEEDYLKRLQMTQARHEIELPDDLKR